MSQSVILRRHPTSERAALAGFARISGQVLEIQRFIRSKPEATHREIVLSLCRLWNWRYMTGELRLAACRHLLHALHDRGHIELPPMDLRERSSWRMHLELEAGRSISSGAAEIGAEIDGAAAGIVSPAAWPEAMCEGDEIRPERLLFDFASLSEEQRRGVLEILHRIGDLGLPVILRQALSRHLVLDLLEMLGMARDGSLSTGAWVSARGSAWTEAPLGEDSVSRSEDPGSAAPEGAGSSEAASAGDEGDGAEIRFRIRWVEEEPASPRGTTSFAEVAALPPRAQTGRLRRWLTAAGSSLGRLVRLLFS